MALVSLHLQKRLCYLPTSRQQSPQPWTVQHSTMDGLGVGDRIKKRGWEDYCRLPFPSVFGSGEWDSAVCEISYQCHIHHDCSASQDVSSQDLPAPEEEDQRREENGSLPSKSPRWIPALYFLSYILLFEGLEAFDILLLNFLNLIVQGPVYQLHPFSFKEWKTRCKKNDNPAACGTKTTFTERQTRWKGRGLCTRWRNKIKPQKNN